MSKLNLYESNWTNLVFENKNKDYGAYQLRQETTRTSFNALFIGILLCGALISLPNLLIPSQEISVPKIPIITDQIIELTNIYSEQNRETTPSAPLPEIKAQTPTELTDKKQLINPTVVSATQATTNVEFTTEKTNSKDSMTDEIAVLGSSTGTTAGVVNGTRDGTGTATDGTSNSNETLIAEMLDSKPQFPGGIEKFYRYIGNNFNSPTLDENKNVRIFVSFVVERDGSMSNIKVINNPGALLEKEAIRVLKSIKAKWTPGILHSKPVRTAYNLPITVQVN